MVSRIRIVLLVGFCVLPPVPAADAGNLSIFSGGNGAPTVRANVIVETGSYSFPAGSIAPLPPRSVLSQAAGASSRLLEFIATVTLPGSAQFAAEDHFIEDISSRARVPIAWLGGTFKRRLLGKIEQNVENVVLNVYRLRLSSRNRSILAELEERPETKLAHVWEMLAEQPFGEAGPLLTNVRANIFYIRDMEGTLWAVDVVWGGAGWEIGASSLEDPAPWRAGHQLFSR